jgi:DeoR family suf operon transcriptional repressor
MAKKEETISTREKIIRILANRRNNTINELAEAVGINPISVRHHITKLEAEGMVDSNEERHGVGRPRRKYFLTEAGMELFPSRYLTLSTRLLEQLKETLPEKALNEIIRKLAGGMAQELTADIQIEGLNHAERMALLQSLLTSEGFTVEIRQEGDRVLIHETSCPYYHVGQEHHEVCMLDETLIHTILGTPVEQIQCMLDGDGLCTYEAPIIPLEEIGAIGGKA